MAKFAGMCSGKVLAATALASVILAGLVGVAQGSFAPALEAPRTTDASELVLTLDPAASKVHWTLDTSLHAVHGTFALKRGTLRIDTASGKAGGEIVADAASGESGNSSRDKRMHKEVLESPRYTEVTFRPERLDGTPPVQLPANLSAQLRGVLALHGVDHQLTVPVRAELAGGHWKGTSTFCVPYVAWGLKNPSNFLLKAEPVVTIELQLAGTIENQKTP